MNKAFYKEIKDLSRKKDITLVAVSKTKPHSSIETLYKVGQRVFGENKVQELVEKQEALPEDIEWHFIGHLQKNKVKYISPFVTLIHAVDSLSLLKEINKRASQNDRIIQCLIQFHIAKEDSKFGLLEENIEDFFNKTKEYRHTEIVGVMGMATFTDNTSQIRNEFKTLKSIFNSLKTSYFSQQESFKEISMGMSGDYSIAIEEGTTMIRIGSSIFGSR